MLIIKSNGNLCCSLRAFSSTRNLVSLPSNCAGSFCWIDVCRRRVNEWSGHKFGKPPIRCFKGRVGRLDNYLGLPLDCFSLHRIVADPSSPRPIGRVVDLDPGCMKEGAQLQLYFCLSLNTKFSGLDSCPNLSTPSGLFWGFQSDEQPLFQSGLLCI